MKRVLIASIVGFLFGPLVSAAALTIYTAIMDGRVGDGLPMLFAIYYSACAVVTVVLGVPVFLVLSRFDLVRAWSSLLAGAVIGALVAVTIGSKSIESAGLVALTASGAVGALAFWLVWFFGSGERSAN
ncbi:MAG TPA: hypothetical protein VE907_14120 [Gammaproteobacteria bacterium]|nr:hypothetical protein [Gammaproteobacteria bacterium]